MRNSVVFDSDLKDYVLSVFGKKTDKDGYVVDKALPSQREYDEGVPVAVKDFAGVRKGSILFFRTDISSLLKVADTLKK